MQIAQIETGAKWMTYDGKPTFETPRERRYLAAIVNP
jgi:hypothetical protein